MPLPSSDNLGAFSKQDQSTGVGDFNSIAFVVAQMIKQINKVTLVKVVAVTNEGEVSAVGYVDVQPMVDQLDARNNAVPHAVIYGIPYFRIQGGADAIIIDPRPGDIGICLFADRDISSVKATQQQSTPGSKRRNSLSDGLYVGGVLNGTPTQYIRFFAGGIEMTTPGTLTLRGASIVLDGPTSATSTIDVAVDVTAAGVSLVHHLQSGVQSGSDPSGPPLPS